MNQKGEELLEIEEEQEQETTRTGRTGQAVELRRRAGRLTPEGLHKLEAELQEAQEVRLPELAERIRSIRQMAADLSESGEYYQALDDLSQLQARIAELRFAIGSGEVREERPVARGHVHLGSVVTLSLDGDQETYQVVGSVEADALEGRISEDSPLGRALLGHASGELVKWTSPGGANSARITRVA